LRGSSGTGTATGGAEASPARRRSVDLTPGEGVKLWVRPRRIC
jgi:hypothetical protein